MSLPPLSARHLHGQVCLLEPSTFQVQLRRVLLHALSPTNARKPFSKSLDGSCQLAPALLASSMVPACLILYIFVEPFIGFATWLLGVRLLSLGSIYYYYAPSIYALGQHESLVAERLLAFLGDSYVVTTLESRWSELGLGGILDGEVGRGVGVAANLGKAQIYNVLQRSGRRSATGRLAGGFGAFCRPDSRFVALGGPIGHQDFVVSQADERLRAGAELLRRLLLLSDLSCAWLLLVYSAAQHDSWRRVNSWQPSWTTFTLHCAPVANGCCQRDHRARGRGCCKPSPNAWVSYPWWPCAARRARARRGRVARRQAPLATRVRCFVRANRPPGIHSVMRGIAYEFWPLKSGGLDRQVPASSADCARAGPSSECPQRTAKKNILARSASDQVRRPTYCNRTQQAALENEPMRSSAITRPGLPPLPMRQSS